MKSQFLKIAGVKTDSQFYKLFPSEASFFKKHPEAKKYIQTAQNGADVDNNGIPDLLQEEQQNYGINTFNIPQLTSLKQSGIKQLPSAQMSVMKPTDIKTGLLKQNVPKAGMLDKMGGVAGIASNVGGIVQGFQMLEEGKKAKKEANQFNEYSKVALMASQTRPEEIKRKYNRPEDNIISGDQLFPINGVGTNVLARNGKQISNKNLKYITAEDGYELTDGDYSNFGAMGSQLYSGLTNSQNNGGSKIGGSVGKLAGTAIGGPLGGMIGEIGGTIIGDALDSIGRDTKKYQDASKRNMDQMFLQDSFRGSQQQNNSFLENGGELSELEQSGELETMWGGDVEPISNNPYTGETIMFRGQSHSETDNNGNSGIGINYGDNRVEVERGEPATVLSDPKTGQKKLNIFGNLFMKENSFIQDFLQDENAYNKKVKNYVADLSKEETKLNKYIETSKTNIEALEGTTSFDKIELESNNIKLQGAMMKLKNIANKKQSLSEFQNIINDTAEEHGFKADDLARGKITRDTNKSKELKEAMYGYEIPLAKNGYKDPGKRIRTKVGAQSPRTYTQSGNDSGLFSNMTEKNVENFKTKNKALFKEQGIDLDAVDFKAKLNPKWNNKTAKFEDKWIPSDSLKNMQVAYNAAANNYNSKRAPGVPEADMLNVDGKYGEDTNSVNAEWMNFKSAKSPNLKLSNQAEINAKTTPDKKEDNKPIIEYKRSPYIDAFNQVLPFIRPSNATELDGNQLLGETYGMSNNQLEPVQSQNYRPELRTPYDISYQDQLNEITASERAAQRMSAYNPEAAAQIAAQSYQGKSRVLAEQFRANQAMKEGVYSQNTQTLNDAQLKNLDINDRQYTRQEQAKSNTKAINQAILNSVSSKYQQNKLENKTLGIQENMYNYRFDKSGRAQNMNGIFQANVDQSNFTFDKDGKPTHRIVRNKQGNIINYELLDTTTSSEDSVQPITSNKKYDFTPQEFKPLDLSLKGTDFNENYQDSFKSKPFKLKNGAMISNSTLVKSLK